MEGRPPKAHSDVIVVGAGHNGLVAALLLARNGLDVLVLEDKEVIGGAVRSERPFVKAPAAVHRQRRRARGGSHGLEPVGSAQDPRQGPGRCASPRPFVSVSDSGCLPRPRPA